MPRGGKPGRPPKFSGPTKLFAVRMPIGLLERIDRFAQRHMASPTATRSNAVRHLLKRSLDDVDLQAAELRETAREVFGVVGTQLRRRR